MSTKKVKYIWCVLSVMMLTGVICLQFISLVLLELQLSVGETQLLFTGRHSGDQGWKDIKWFLI